MLRRCASVGATRELARSGQGGMPSMVGGRGRGAQAVPAHGRLLMHAREIVQNAAASGFGPISLQSSWAIWPDAAHRSQRLESAGTARAARTCRRRASIRRHGGSPRFQPVEYTRTRSPPASSSNWPLGTRDSQKMAMATKQTVPFDTLQTACALSLNAHAHLPQILGTQSATHWRVLRLIRPRSPSCWCASSCASWPSRRCG